MADCGAGGAVERWAEALGRWSIPEWILARAVESPWTLPPSLFAADATPTGALHRIAAESLPPGGTVLDVGCGGGGASLPLADVASRIVGVDESAEMLESFAGAARSLAVPFDAVQGRWPDVAASAPGDALDSVVPVCDVVVGRNVVYNVAELADFVVALGSHAAVVVVVELTEKHPSSWLAPLWKHFWGLDLPDEPTAALFGEVLETLGVAPRVGVDRRPAVKAAGLDDRYVSFVRRRLCLDPARDAEVRSCIEAMWPSGPPQTDSVVVWWAGVGVY